MGPALGLVVGVGLSACRPPASETPRVDVRDMSLDDIEAELDRNYELLADAGIAVASVETRDPALKAQPEAELEDDGGGGERIEQQEPDSAQLGDEEPSEPIPAAATAPDDYGRESVALEPANRRRRNRRQQRSTYIQERREPSRCERVCDLADATCDLEAQICDLASHHPEQERYQLACTRAEAQCEAAMEACERCDEE